jgi:hypothetical protein
LYYAEFTQLFRLPLPGLSARFARPSLLGESPLREGTVAEKVQFKIQLNLFVDIVMAMIWGTGGNDFRHRSAMANWLQDCFFPHAGRLVTDTPFAGNPIQGLALEHSIRISLAWRLYGDPRPVRSCYSWLFHRLMPAWRNHPELPGAVMSHFSDLVANQLGALSEMEHGEELIATFVQPLIQLPPGILEALLKNPALEPNLKRHIRLGQHIGELDLFIPREDFDELINKCIENYSNKPAVGVVNGGKIEVEFVSGDGVKDCIVVSGEAANGLRKQERILTPYIRLEHPNPRVRLEWLDDLTAAGILDRDTVFPWRDALFFMSRTCAIKVRRKSSWKPCLPSSRIRHTRQRLISTWTYCT